jgi:hypothetical protein
MNEREPLIILCFKLIAPYIQIKNPFAKDFFILSKSGIQYSYLEQFFFSSFYYKPKFECLSDMFENSFTSSENKEKLFSYFTKAQFLCNFFRKFYFKKTYEKLKRHDNDEDLNLTPFSKHRKENIINIVENDVIYKFFIFDLIKIINTNLCYSYAMFVEPKCSRNPYTNVPFSLHNLYNIYFFIKKLQIKMPTLVHLYFQCNFDTDIILLNYECVIRDEIIKFYYHDTTEEKKYNDILDIIKKYKNITSPIIIHRRYSKKNVVEKLGFLLKMNLYCNYSYNPSKRTYYKIMLKKKLKLFVKENPLFGRIQLTTNSFRNRPPSMFNSNIIRNYPYDYFESVPNLNSPTPNNYNRFNRYRNSRFNYNTAINTNSIVDNIIQNTLENRVISTSNITINSIDSIADSNELSPIDTETITTPNSSEEPEPIINEPDSDSGHEDNNQEL